MGFADRVKPWTCAACGKANISANKTACPECGAPRGATATATSATTATAQAVGTRAAVQQVTREYQGEKALRKGIAQMARQGWRVASQSSYQPRAGVGRILAIGLFAAIFKPKVKFVVVFERNS